MGGNNKTVKKSKEYTVGGLFAGVGGICRGFKDAGFRMSWANEFDKNAGITYQENFKHAFYSDDVRDLVKDKIDELEKVDVITSGFPCQAFSIAGHRRGFDDDRGGLFFETMKIVEAVKPKVVLLENVKNLQGHDNGNTFKVIEESISDLGYSFLPYVLNSMKHGNVPQNRERIYIVCFRNEANWKEVGSKSICSTAFEPIKEVPLTKTVRKDILENKKVDDRYYYTDKSRYYKMLKSEMKSKDTVYQWRRVYLRENKSGVCPTLTANMGTGGHNVPLVLDNYGMRKLTPLECSRLQGFGDNFVLPFDRVCDSQLYKQIGNSVTVPVAMRIATEIKRVLDLKYRKHTRTTNAY